VRQPRETHKPWPLRTLGLVEPDLRSTYSRLATIRHKLAHGRRQPAEITKTELQAIRVKLDPDLKTDLFLLGGVTTATPAIMAGLTILAAYSKLDISGSVIRHIREREREAFRKEMAAQAIPSPLIQALLAGARAADEDDRTGAQPGAQEP
jgi:hypothetical protein